MPRGPQSRGAARSWPLPAVPARPLAAPSATQCRQWFPRSPRFWNSLFAVAPFAVRSRRIAPRPRLAARFYSAEPDFCPGLIREPWGRLSPRRRFAGTQAALLPRGASAQTASLFGSLSERLLSTKMHTTLRRGDGRGGECPRESRADREGRREEGDIGVVGKDLILSSDRFSRNRKSTLISHGRKLFLFSISKFSRERRIYMFVAAFYLHQCHLGEKKTSSFVSKLISSSAVRWLERF